MTSDAQTRSCPNCSAALVIESRWTRIAVCSTCQSAVTFDEASTRVAGQLSVLPPSRTKLFAGVTGRLKGRPFQALGRVRYGHERGYWDEWYILWTDDGQTGWLSEDEDRVVLETLEPGTATMVPPNAEPGTSASLYGQTFNVVERGEGVVEGGEGELPFMVVQGERTLFVEMRSSDGVRIATVEFTAEGRRVFVGEALKPDDLALDWTREEMGITDDIPLANKADGSVERLQSLAGGIRPLKCCACGGGLEVAAGNDGVLPQAVGCAYCGVANTLGGKSVACPNCEGSVQTVAGDAKVGKCASCKHQIDLVARSGPQSMGRSPAKGARFRLGHTWKFEGVDYRVTGRIKYDGFSEGEHWHYWEYCVFAPTVGYRWLVESDGEWSLSERVFDYEAVGSDASPSSITYQGSQFRVAEIHHVTLSVADGELPWVAKVGDTVRVLDTAAVAGRKLSIEWSPQEVEWYLCRTLKHSDVFGKAKGSSGRKTSSTKTHGRWWAHAMWLGLLTLCVGMGLAFYYDELGEQRVDSASYGAAMFSPGGQTHTMSVPQDRLMTFKLESKGDVVGNGANSLRGGWVHYSVTVVRSDGVKQAFTSTHADFYTGGTGPYQRRKTTRFGLQLPAGDTKVTIAASSGNVDDSRAAQPQVPLVLELNTGAPWQTGSLEGFLVVVFFAWFVIGFIQLSRSSERAPGPKVPIPSVLIAALLAWGLWSEISNIRPPYDYSVYAPKVQSAPLLTPVAAYQANRAAYRKANVRAGSSTGSYGGSSSSRSYYRTSYSYGK